MKTITVKLSKIGFENIWCKIKLSLPSPQTGNFIEPSSTFRNRIKPADQEAMTFEEKNWLSGVFSGVHYGLRKSRLPSHKGVVLHHLSGHLSGGDINGICLAASIATLRLHNQPASLIELEGWKECNSG